MNYDIVAIIGCITGCIGLSINLYRLITERFNLKINVVDGDSLIFDRMEGCTYNTTRHCVMHLEFINKSNHPISIYSISAFVKERELFPKPYEGNELRILEFFEKKFPNRQSYLAIPMDRQLCLPVRLQPHDTYTGILFFPFFPDCNSETNVVFNFFTTKRHVKKKYTVRYIHAQEHVFPD